MSIFTAGKPIDDSAHGSEVTVLPGLPGGAWLPAESRWESLRYYSLYRLIIACGLAFVGRLFLLGDSGLNLWSVVVTTYFFAAVGLLYFQRLGRLRFDWVLNLHIAIDILVLSTLLFVAGGHRSGVPYMVMVVVAAGGLLGQGRLVFFYASLASVSVLLVQALRVVWTNETDAASDFVAVGVICIGFFAVATIARLLATRALANERLAHLRGAALAKQVQLNERIIEELHDGVLVVDEHSMLIQGNPTAADMLGQPIRRGEPLSSMSAALARALAEGVSPVRVEHEGKRVSVRVRRADDEGDTLIYLSDFDQAEREAQQIKLVALGRLTANIAHEIRNPLSAISHAGELLVDEKRGEMQTRLTRIILENSRRIERMVKDVLELGRRDRVTTETIMLDVFIGGFLEESFAYENVDRGMVSYVGSPEAFVRFDRVHLQQILWNLLGNARRYCSKAQGSVRIEVELLGEGRVALHLCDDGPGIPPEARAQVFEPFFTSDPKGTGLGLYIARELAVANDAWLELRESACGAHFCLLAKGGEHG